MNASDATRATRPRFAERANAIAREARELKAGDLKTLMGVSDAIAKLNVERFGNFEKGGDEGVRFGVRWAGIQALEGVDVEDGRGEGVFTETFEDFKRVVRLPAAVRRHRAVPTRDGNEGGRRPARIYTRIGGEDIALAIADDLDEQAATSGESSARPFVVNCASQEYWKSGQARGVDKARRRRVHDDVSRTRSVRQTSSRSHGSTLRRRSSGFARRSENLSGHGRVLEV